MANDVSRIKFATKLQGTGSCLKAKACKKFGSKYVSTSWIICVFHKGLNLHLDSPCNHSGHFYHLFFSQVFRDPIRKWLQNCVLMSACTSASKVFITWLFPLYNQIMVCMALIQTELMQFLGNFLPLMTKVVCVIFFGWAKQKIGEGALHFLFPSFLIFASSSQRVGSVSSHPCGYLTWLVFSLGIHLVIRIQSL